MNSVESFIVGLLKKKGPLPAGVDPLHYRYLDLGHIDSMGVLKFVMAIEDEFGIELSDADLTSDAFRTPAGLAQLVQGKMP